MMGLDQATRKYGTNTGAPCCKELLQYTWPQDKPFEDVWHDWIQVVQKLPCGALSAQTVEQLTTSGLVGHGQIDLGSHVTIRAPLSCHGVQIHIEKCSATIYGEPLLQPMDIGSVTRGKRLDWCSRAHQGNNTWYEHETCNTCHTWAPVRCVLA